MTAITLPTYSGNATHFGLREIFTNANVVDDSNIVAVLASSLSDFEWNKKQIKELHDIYKGDQIILHRVPNSNQPANERVNMNLFPAVSTIWVGLILGEKTDYVFNGESKESQKQDDVSKLVRMIRYNDDVLLDKEALLELFISGVAYAYTGGQKQKNNPIKLAMLPTDSTFVVKSRDIGYPVVLTAIYGVDENGNDQITAFTDTKKYILAKQDKKKEFVIVKSERHFLPTNPIQEVRLNPQYLSMVAQGEASQNALNMAMSESINDTIFQMRSMLLITGAELTADQIVLAKEHGVLNVNPTDGRSVSAQYLAKPLDETITSLRSLLFDTIKFIMGLPSTDGGTSGNSGAALVASGMQTMDLVAYSIQLEMKKAKKAMLDNIIEIMVNSKMLSSDLNATDIEIAFDRQLVMNIVEAADAFSKLKAAGFPDRDNLKVTKVTSDVARVAKEMESLAKKQEEAIKKAVDEGLKNNNTDPQADPKAQPTGSTESQGGSNNA